MKKILFITVLSAFFVACFAQTGNWALVMSKNGDFDQIWRTTDYFPEKEIQEFWDKEYRITSLTFGAGKWALVMSKDGDYAQSWRINQTFPENEIKEYWDKNFKISSLSYGNDKWAVVMSKTGDYAQAWRTNIVFPDKEIQEFWDKGYKISSLSYGNGKWALVMSKDGDYAQAWRTRTYFPEDEIKEYWDKGFRITSLTYGNGLWALVMSKKGDYAQLWRTKTYFPEDEIKENLNKHFKITMMAYGPKQIEPEENQAPEIAIFEPDLSRGYKIVEAETIIVSGKATDIDGIKEVTVNGRRAPLKDGMYFSLSIPVTDGSNIITVKAIDKKLKSSTKTFEINHKTVEIDETFTTNERRVALVFGNSNYTGSANLGANPVNDANDMADVLRSLGFEVIVKIDADLNTMNNAVREFGRINKDADVALFFFAGHGMQIERVNYLLPVGVNIQDKNDVSFECLSVETVQDIMESSNENRLNLLILDACRNNPFRTWERGGAAGLSDMTPPSGTLIAFATSPGSTASNGDDRNGLYTGELIRQLKKAQRIEDVFINTRIEVERKSDGQQSPWELARLRGVYYLKK